MALWLNRRQCLQVAALAALGGCTATVVRPDIETRHYTVDWGNLDAPILPMQGVSVRSVILAPSQWPLEASLKRLLQGDFVGVLDALRITFTPSRLPTGLLSDLYDRGFVPVYVRVENNSTEQRRFQPERLALDAGGDPLLPVGGDSLPAAFNEVDWERTALAVASVVLIVWLISDGRSRGDLGRAFGVPHGKGRRAGHANIYVSDPLLYEQTGGPAPDAGGHPAPSAPPPERRADPGVLRDELLAPGEAREGLVFFHHKGRLVDWSRARLSGR